MNIRKKFTGQIIVLTMFLLFLGVGMISGTVFQITKVKEYRNEIKALNNKLETTEQQINELKNAENNKDLNNLEKIARTKLNMVKPNEIVYIVTE